MPFTEPPVATLGLPFCFFFVLSISGSSQLPSEVPVAENVLTWEGVPVAMIANWGGIKGEAGDILNPWRAVRRGDAFRFISFGERDRRETQSAEEPKACEWPDVSRCRSSLGSVLLQT